VVSVAEPPEEGTIWKFPVAPLLHATANEYVPLLVGPAREVGVMLPMLVLVQVVVLVVQKERGALSKDVEPPAFKIGWPSKSPTEIVPPQLLLPQVVVVNVIVVAIPLIVRGESNPFAPALRE
jgi:hypothetical protein